MLNRIASLLHIQPPTVDGLLSGSGITVPVDGTAGWETGATFSKTDGGLNNSLFTNEGTSLSSAFKALKSDVITTKVFTQTLPFVATLSVGEDSLPILPDGTNLGLANIIGAPIVGTATNGTSLAQVNERCGFSFVIPADYRVGEDVTCRIKAFVSVARATLSPLGVIAKLVKDGALDTTDLILTTPSDMKDIITETDVDFTIDSDAVGDELASGSIVHIEINFETNDTSGVADGFAQINSIEMLVPSYQ